MLVDFNVSNQGDNKNFITPMAAGVKEALETETITVVTDGGYESVQDIMAAAGQGATVHVAGTDFDICIPAAAGAAVGEITAHHNGRCVYIADRNIPRCPMGNVLPPQFHTERNGGYGVFHNYEACRKCANKRTKDAAGRCKHQVPMAEAGFTKEYNDQGLAVKQVRIKPDPAIVKQRRSIVHHPFGTIKRAMNILGCKKLIEHMA